MVDDMFIDSPQFEFEAQGTVVLDADGNLPFDSIGSSVNDGEDVRKLRPRVDTANRTIDKQARCDISF